MKVLSRDTMMRYEKMKDRIEKDTAQREVRKGLGEIIGGKVLELESDKLIKKGEQFGWQRCEKAVTELTKKLLAENRLDDLKRSVEDPEYQRKLLQKIEGTK